MKKLMVLSIIVNMMFLTGCHMILNMPLGAQEAITMNAAESGGEYSYEVTRNDYNILEKDAVEIDPHESIEGVYGYDDGKLTIYAAGDYILTGNLGDVNLIISVFDDEIVHLFLDNVEINSNSGSTIYVENANKVIITSIEGTKNIISDGSGHEEAHKACIFSNSDLTINGEGILYVYGYYADGIRSKERLKLVNTNLFVKAMEDGIRGNDAVILLDSIAEVECEGTGILSNGDDDMVVLQGGSCKIIAGQNAILSNRYISIHDCLTDLYSIWETVKCNGIMDIG